MSKVTVKQVVTFFATIDTDDCDLSDDYTIWDAAEDDYCEEWGDPDSHELFLYDEQGDEIPRPEES